MALPTVPTESIACLALIRPGSALGRRVASETPTFGIFEFDRSFGTSDLRFGDGSWLRLEREDHEDLILLPEFSGDRLQAFTDTWFVEKPDPALMAHARTGRAGERSNSAAGATTRGSA